MSKSFGQNEQFSDYTGRVKSLSELLLRSGWLDLAVFGFVYASGYKVNTPCERQDT